MLNIEGAVRKCLQDYDMIQDGDRVAVGVSGGKDSLTLLMALSELRRYYPVRFELSAVTVGMGFPGMDFAPVAELCGRLGVPFIYKATEIGPVVFDARHEKNPCALCSKMRRGALNDLIRQRGITKLALGHHMDDAVETFLMSLLYEGRIYCFEPVTYMSRSGVTQIRPLLYCREADVAGYVKKHSLPVVKSTCPMDGESSREGVKNLLKDLNRTYPDVKSKIFGAMTRLPLPGWERRQPTSRENT